MLSLHHLRSFTPTCHRTVTKSILAPLRHRRLSDGRRHDPYNFTPTSSLLHGTISGLQFSSHTYFSLQCVTQNAKRSTGVAYAAQAQFSVEQIFSFLRIRFHAVAIKSLWNCQMPILELVSEHRQRFRCMCFQLDHQDKGTRYSSAGFGSRRICTCVFSSCSNKSTHKQSISAAFLHIFAQYARLIAMRSAKVMRTL